VYTLSLFVWYSGLSKQTQDECCHEKYNSWKAMDTIKAANGLAQDIRKIIRNIVTDNDIKTALLTSLNLRLARADKQIPTILNCRSCCSSLSSGDKLLYAATTS